MIGRVAWVAKRLATSRMSDDAVLAGVVDADVEHVRPALDRLPGHGQAGVPVVGQHGLPELLRPVGVGALADDQERRGLVVGDVAVDRRHARLPVRPSGGRRQMPAGVDDGPQVLRGGAAAPADHADPVLGDEAGVVLGQLGRGQVVVHAAVDHRGQAGVRQDGDRHRAAL